MVAHCTRSSLHGNPTYLSPPHENPNNADIVAHSIRSCSPHGNPNNMDTITHSTHSSPHGNTNNANIVAHSTHLSAPHGNTINTDIVTHSTHSSPHRNPNNADTVTHSMHSSPHGNANNVDIATHSTQSSPHGNPYNADIITLSTQSLGNLRLNYHPRQTVRKVITPKLRKEYEDGKFVRIHVNPERHTLIKGFDNAIIAYHIPASNTDQSDCLLKSIESLPTPQNDNYRGIDRGEYTVRHYCIWCAYAKEPFICSQFCKDGEGAKMFMQANSQLWESMSMYLSELFPGVYKEFMNLPLAPHLDRMAGAFMGCVINMGSGDIPVETKPHRDVKERAFGVSCLCPFGTYKGGALILWELKVIIELNPGDLLFLPDSLIHHSNERVTGIHHSVVAFTQQNMFDYWKRSSSEFRDKKKSKLGKRKEKEKRKRELRKRVIKKAMQNASKIEMD